MKSRKWLALVLVLLCSGFVLLAKADDHNKPKMYDETNTSISVNAAQPYFMIQLKSNPTTGFNWTLGKLDDKLITLVKHEYLPAKAELVGSGGVDVWAFTVKQAALMTGQKLKLTFTYQRPWEKDASSAKTVVFTVSVS